MKLDFLRENIITLISQRKGLLMLTGVFALTNVLLGVALICKSERTILLPPHINKTMWVEGGAVSKEYLEEMGLYMSKILLDLTPTSFSYNHEILLKYATPETYGDLKKQLGRDGEQYTALQLSTHFKPTQVIANPKTLEVEVKGTLASFVAGKHVRDSQETLSLKFTLRGGGILLESVTGGIPYAN